jgi:hypothetical protein
MTRGPAKSPLEAGEEGRAEPYTSPYWDSYNPSASSYAGVEDRASANGRYYPLERDYDSGCGGGGGYSRQSFLQDPSLPVMLLVVGAAATYLLATAIPTAFRRKKRRNLEDDTADWLWSGKESEGSLFRAGLCRGARLM